MNHHHCPPFATTISLITLNVWNNILLHGCRWIFTPAKPVTNHDYCHHNYEAPFSTTILSQHCTHTWLFPNGPQSTITSPGDICLFLLAMRKHISLTTLNQHSEPRLTIVLLRAIIVSQHKIHHQPLLAVIEHHSSPFSI